MKDFTVGFVGFGEVNSPRDRIVHKYEKARADLENCGLCIVDGGMVTDDENRVEAAAALERLKAHRLDALILCITGWIPSYAVIRIADHFKSVPMVLWGLCGAYEDGRLVTTAEQAGTSALRHPMELLGFTFRYIYDTTDGQSALPEILEYLRAAKAKKCLVTAKVGMLGYRDMNLYGTMFDGVSLKEKTGVEIEFMEMLEMVQLVPKADPAETQKLYQHIIKNWHFTKPADEQVLLTGIRYYLALKKMIEKKGYEAVSLIDVDGMKRLLNYPPSLIFMLLANEMKLCTIPENDAHGSVTQLIAKHLTGQNAMYLEFYEFMKDRVLMGVPDYVPQDFTEGPYTITPTNFGLLGESMLNVSRLKTGTVTIARLYKSRAGYGIHLAVAQATAPRSWEEVGWAPPAPQLPSLELILGERTKAFTQNVMGQHYIVTYGDHTSLYKAFCSLSGIEYFEA